MGGVLWEDDERPLEGFSKNVIKRARRFYKGREKRLFFNPQGILCCKRKNSERHMGKTNLILLPQAYHS